MRNYSEIGCLTLLGVTLTVYVAVGNWQPGESVCENPSKNIIAEYGMKSGNRSEGKYYFVKVSAHSTTDNGVSEMMAGIPAIELAETSNFSLLSLHRCHSFYALPGFNYSVISTLHSSFVCLTDDEIYRNPLISFFGEIRAGPSA